MKKLIFSIIFFLGMAYPSLSQDEIWFGDQDTDINVDIVANGTFKTVGVKVDNYTGNNYKVWFPAGSMLINASNDEQNLVVLFNDYINLSPNKMGDNCNIRVGCANADKKVPKRGRKNWEITYDEKLADLLNYYYQNKELIATWTNPKHHDTIDDQHAFLQMCVWIYTGAEKKTITQFVSKYMFDGDYQAAEEYVKYMYPVIVNFINLYKNF